MPSSFFQQLVPIFTNLLTNWSWSRGVLVQKSSSTMTNGLPVEQQLFYFLVWLRHYPTEMFAAWLMDSDQTRAHRNNMRLLILTANWMTECKVIALPSADLRRQRHNIQLNDLEVAIIIDGTHQPIWCPADKDTRLVHFSGKEKDYTRLVLVAISPDGWIYYHTNSFPGSRGDMALFKLPEVQAFIALLDDDEALLADAGFQGALNYHLALTPHKSPKTLGQRLLNGLISSKRWRVERTNGEIKEYKALAQRCRYSLHLHATFFTVACGFVNFRRANWALNVAAVRDTLPIDD